MVAMHAAGWLLQGPITPLWLCVPAGWLWRQCYGNMAYNQPRTILHCVTGPQGVNSMGQGKYGLMVAMNAAVWLVLGPRRPRGYVFLQGGYGGSVTEFWSITHPELNCIV
jgi:hypothetical protein